LIRRTERLGCVIRTLNDPKKENGLHLMKTYVRVGHSVPSRGLICVVMAALLVSSYSASSSEGGTKVQLPTFPQATGLPQVVLFGFDDRAFPFQNLVQTHLIPGRNPKVVLRHGPEGSHDEVLLYYGTVIRIGDTFHLWYNGNYGPLANNIGYERVNCCICYATSRDGVTWVKPELGLVEFKGSKKNNIVDLAAPDLWSTFAVLHDKEEPDANRRFKAAYEARIDGQLRFCVAFSPDGLHWTPSAKNPVGPFLEMAGVTKHRGLYYVSGQTLGHRPVVARRLVTFASADFETWSACGAVGLDRSPNVSGTSTEGNFSEYEEVHLGAALWNRGNVMLGIYGQWHGHFSGDRRLVVMDLGLALTHDAVHYYEPIPSFRFIPAREQPESPGAVGPALEQGQGMENVGNQTLYWYSLWRGTEGSGIRMVTWPRDRLGMLKPFRSGNPQTISCPIRVEQGVAKVYVNASGLNKNSQLRLSLLDQGFRPIPGFSGGESAVLSEDGYRLPIRWPGGDSLLPPQGLVRFQVDFGGMRPEDGALHAIYVGEVDSW